MIGNFTHTNIYIYIYIYIEREKLVRKKKKELLTFVIRSTPKACLGFHAKEQDEYNKANIRKKSCHHLLYWAMLASCIENVISIYIHIITELLH
jgi:hypothetical protein